VISEAEARHVAEAELEKNFKEKRVVVITRVGQHKFGWAYHFETTPPFDLIGGQPVVLVSRRDGRTLPTGCGPLNECIREHDRRAAWEDGASDLQKATTLAVEELSYIGPGMKRPVLERLQETAPESSSDVLREAIAEATIIGEQALELTKARPRAPSLTSASHADAAVIAQLVSAYPDIYPRVWGKLWLRAEYWWKWEI
jgi:hypothetical protein